MIPGCSGRQNRASTSSDPDIEPSQGGLVNVEKVIPASAQEFDTQPIRQRKTELVRKRRYSDSEVLPDKGKDKDIEPSVKRSRSHDESVHTEKTVKDSSGKEVRLDSSNKCNRLPVRTPPTPPKKYQAALATGIGVETDDTVVLTTALDAARQYFSNVAGAGQPPTAPELTGSDSVADEPSFNDDDDFYLLYVGLYVGSYSSPGSLKQETIEQLNKDHPGIFNGLDNPNDLFSAKPVKYQPLAKLIHDTPFGALKRILDSDIGVPCWCAKKMRYGEYKGDFYKIIEDFEGTQCVNVYSDHYELMLENKRFVSQLREFLFDQSMSNDEKVVNLQMLFPPIEQSDEAVSIKQLRENMNFLFGNTFKQAQQRAINSGFKP